MCEQISSCAGGTYGGVKAFSFKKDSDLRYTRSSRSKRLDMKRGLFLVESDWTKSRLASNCAYPSCC